MAPVPVTEDYYMVLEVKRTATNEQIVRSYRRLALKLHPDRNDKHDATQAFQLLLRAYETMKDESKRREYDLIYPSITRAHPSTQKPTETSRPSPASSPQTEVPSEAAQIAKLERSKKERGARWQTKKNVFDSSIFELQRDVRQLEQAIKNLNIIAAAEAAEEAQKNSWGTWLLSPIYKKAEDSEEKKARKDRERQERRIEKDMKERRLASKKADLKKEETLLRNAKAEIDAADVVDDRKIRVIQERILARKAREREERERVERERMEKILKQRQEQWQKQQREAAEALRKEQEEQRAAEQKRQEEQLRKWQKIIADEAAAMRAKNSTGINNQASTSNCGHHGWWAKVEGRTSCPKCSESWTYLLQCPGCKMKACPRCQYDIRPKGHHRSNPARTNRRAPPRARSPSPVSFHDDYGYDWYD